jgi:hypothetical protein
LKVRVVCNRNIETIQTKMDLTPDYVSIYLNQMTEKEKKAYEIAKSHLGCSFDLKKSDGFLCFVKKEKEKEKIDQANKDDLLKSL